MSRNATVRAVVCRISAATSPATILQNRHSDTGPSSRVHVVTTRMMDGMFVRTGLAVVVTASALVLTGCGGSDSQATDDPTPAAVTSTATGASSPAAPTDTS